MRENLQQYGECAIQEITLPPACDRVDLGWLFLEAYVRCN